MSGGITVPVTGIAMRNPRHAPHSCPLLQRLEPSRFLCNPPEDSLVESTLKALRYIQPSTDPAIYPIDFYPDRSQNRAGRTLR
ncbi:hypothetical protein J6590_054814 [Homalodisca vitripennis]|nr:hypothetical protein J6590_054814 [Homalodisca vitripennis]